MLLAFVLPFRKDTSPTASDRLLPGYPTRDVGSGLIRLTYGKFPYPTFRKEGSAIHELLCLVGFERNHQAYLILEPDLPYTHQCFVLRIFCGTLPEKIFDPPSPQKTEEGFGEQLGTFRSERLWGTFLTLD